MKRQISKILRPVAAAIPLALVTHLMLLSILSVPAMATPYTIAFTTSSGVAPTSGSFNYDATNGFSNFLVKWDGITYNMTSSANTVPDGKPEIVFGLGRSELSFAVLSQTLSAATSYYWEATDPGGAVSYNYFDFHALTSSTPVIIDGEKPPTHLPFVTTGTGPTWQISVVSTLPGDYNGNGIVDAADYTLWRDTLGSTTNLAADGNGNGNVDQADYDVWKQHFGQTAQITLFPAGGAGSVAGLDTAGVPEPATMALLIVGLLAIYARRRVAAS